MPSLEQSETFFSYFIRFLRKRLGCTQTYVARLTGYSPAYVSCVENGQAFRNISKTHRIIYTLGYHPEILHECTGKIMRIRDND